MDLFLNLQNCTGLKLSAVVVTCGADMLYLWDLWWCLEELFLHVLLLDGWDAGVNAVCLFVCMLSLKRLWV